MAVIGEFRAGVLLGDRKDMSTEVIPHIFDAATGMPTGERVIVAFRRSGVVRDANKRRFLEVPWRPGPTGHDGRTDRPLSEEPSPA